MLEKPFNLNPYLALALIVVAVAIASIDPLEFEAYLLHQAGTVFMLIVLLLTFKKVGLDYASFCCYLVFLLIHIIGAQYLYSYVPYNQWLLYFFNFDLDQSMGWSRNMYDRLVHFSDGLLFYAFVYRCFPGWLRTAKPISLLMIGVCCTGRQ